MGILAEDKAVAGTLTAVWDGITPAEAPAHTTVEVSQPANGSVGFQLSGTFSATVTFEASLDCITYVAVPATKIGATPVQATTATAAGIYVVHAPSAKRVRARCSTFVSGTVVVTANGSVAGFSTAAAGLGTQSGSPNYANVEGTTAAGASWATGKPIGIGFIGSGATLKNATAINSLDNVAVPDALGVGVVVRNGAAGNYFAWRGNALGEGAVLAGGYTDIISATLTRPADTTAYAAGDEVTDTGGTIRTLTGIARASGGTGSIRGVQLAFSDNWAVKPSLELHVYDTTSTPQTDNAAFAPSDAVELTKVCVIPITTVAVGDATANTGNFTMDTGPIDFPFKCVGSANLFLRFVVRNAGQAGANSSTITARVRVYKD
jgi:hypothetical protein